MIKITWELRNKAHKYIASIRNIEKKRFANHYYNFKLDVWENPNESIFDLGAMAKQAVRMNIDNILE